MNQDYFRKFLFNGSFLDDTIVRAPAHGVAKETGEAMFGAMERQAPETLLGKFTQKFADKYKSAAEKLNTSGMSF
jgi:hypothetical protein